MEAAGYKLSSPLQCRFFLAPPPGPDAATAAATAAVVLSRCPRARVMPVLSANNCPPTTSAWNGGALAAVSSDGAEGPMSFLPPPVRIVAIVGDGVGSPLRSASWEEVMHHTAIRLKWVDEGFQILVHTCKSFHADDPGLGNLRSELVHADILLIVAINDKEMIDWLELNSESIPNVISFESSPAIRNKLGGSYVQSKVEGNLCQTLISTVKGESKKESSEVVRTLCDAWDRHNSDDIRFCLLVIINAYIRPVPILKNLRAKGFSTLNCMIKNCGSEVLNCFLDPNCRKALQCLNSCSPTDQVCNYRCIASYESPYLEAFSLCVLQKHNCLALDAEIPDKPYVLPMATFRGEALRHETAEDLFVGWLGSLEWSWRVVAGQNPAYDQFPCQYQLFYRGKAKGSFWYEPVFQVRTLEGQRVWRRRKYRVRRARDPGTFYFSVLDNGVVSKEYWAIVDVCDDLSWGLFHYKGAAQAAGQSYTGAVLVSPDGRYPAGMGGQRLASALEKCCIKEWELYTVDNHGCLCTNAPLGIPEGSSLRCTIDIRDERWSSV